MGVDFGVDLELEASIGQYRCLGEGKRNRRDSRDSLSEMNQFVSSELIGLRSVKIDTTVHPHMQICRSTLFLRITRIQCFPIISCPPKKITVGFLGCMDIISKEKVEISVDLRLL